ncbi:hypothetical protein [Pseudomonas lurida]|uniref:non-homologous end-joining DNA ligase LigD n=1 Tax=Pseudomonas TaxID=286 RepID=UPI0035C04183
MRTAYLTCLLTCPGCCSLAAACRSYLRSAGGIDGKRPPKHNYSVRTREGLPVSVPIFRDELKKIKDAAVWNIENVYERLAQLVVAPWAHMPETKQTVTGQIWKRISLK